MEYHTSEIQEKLIPVHSVYDCHIVTLFDFKFHIHIFYILWVQIKIIMVQLPFKTRNTISFVITQEFCQPWTCSTHGFSLDSFGL